MIINKLLNLNLKKYKSILCLNGDLPDKSFFSSNKVIIAADGAANKLTSIGIKPNMVIGDLDSLDLPLELPTIKIIDQDSTDFEKSLKYIKDNDLAPTLVYGVNGGFIDHILHNIAIVMQHDCTFYSPPITGITLSANQEINLELKISTKLSLIGIDSVVNSDGLKWELTNYHLNFPYKSSCSNRSVKDTVKIAVESGKALIMIYEDDQHDQGKLHDHEATIFTQEQVRAETDLFGSVKDIDDCV